MVTTTNEPTMRKGNTATELTREQIEAAYAATAPTWPGGRADGTGGARHYGPAHWRYFVHTAKAWAQGKLPCDCCTEETQADCGDCMGTGRKIIGPLNPWVPSMIDLENGIAGIADIVSEIEAREALSLLPERSRRLIEELRDGLGEQLYTLLGRLEDLEEDMRNACDDPRWPAGEALYDAQTANCEARQAAREADAE